MIQEVSRENSQAAEDKDPRAVRPDKGQAESKKLPEVTWQQLNAGVPKNPTVWATVDVRGFRYKLADGREGIHQWDVSLDHLVDHDAVLQTIEKEMGSSVVEVAGCILDQSGNGHHLEWSDAENHLRKAEQPTLELTRKMLRNNNTENNPEA